jgi:hypothetical protein
MSSLGGWFGLGGRRFGGGGWSRIHSGSVADKDEEERKKIFHSEAAKKGAAKCSNNYGQ